MSFKDTFSILDKINLIKQYLTGNVIMCSENLDGNKREKKKITFLHTKKKVCLHRVGAEGCSHSSPRLFRTVVECEQRIRLRNPLFYSAESSFKSLLWPGLPEGMHLILMKCYSALTSLQASLF